MKLFLILPLPQEENVICPSSERRQQCICVFLWFVEPKCYHQEAVWFKVYSLTWLTMVSPTTKQGHKHQHCGTGVN